MNDIQRATALVERVTTVALEALGEPNGMHRSDIRHFALVALHAALGTAVAGAEPDELRAQALERAAMTIHHTALARAAFPVAYRMSDTDIHSFFAACASRAHA